jgi:hypothetical protein
MGEAEGEHFRRTLDSPAARQELIGSSTGKPWPSPWSTHTSLTKC